MKKINNPFLDEIISARRWLHEHPELSYKEYATTKYIREKIQSWNLDLKPFSTLDTGGYVDVGTGEMPMLGFRADIDALPITENTGHSIKSKNDGVMHACGHDFHTAIGVGLAKYYSQHSDELNGRLRILFQPAEETYPDGASHIHKEPLFNTMIGIIAVHVDLRFKIGEIAIKQGTACASSTLLKLKFGGPGGHTSRPHDTVDLIRITALYISQLNGYLKSIIDSRDDFTLVFGSIHGGQYHNIIPSEVSLTGTLRNFDNDVLNVLLKSIREFSANFATLYKCQINLDIPNSTPAIVNDPAMYSDLVRFCKDNGYDERLIEMEKPSMGADDFAYYLRNVPGLYFQVGTEGSGSSHSSDFILNDDLIEPAVDFIAQFIKFFLNKPFQK
ncbi:MAG: amidohydrolase [Candidatus Marinimicrobia bacterium]|nr:amidohydrolase [Candidatus Neomarinimicrobiota bacterium]